MRRAVLMAACMVLLGIGMTGCGGYAMRGRVVSGDVSYVAVVDPGDPRLDGKGLAGVSLHVQSDPGRLNRKTVGRGVSGADGEINVPIDLIGAGMLEYEAGVFARRKGREPANGFFELPSSKKRILIVMSTGEDRDLGEEREDLMGQTELYR